MSFFIFFVGFVVYMDFHVYNKNKEAIPRHRDSSLKACEGYAEE